MPTSTLRPLLRIAVAAVCVVSVPAFASPQRTFVSSYGADVNPCTLTLPCRGFAAAVAQVNTGGEVIALDSAGYGVTTITQSVSIIAPVGVFAGISVLPTFDGIVVNGPDIVVTLKGLSINGQGGNIGINFLQGARLAINGCAITAMTGEGISATAVGASVTISDTLTRGNGGLGGIKVTGLVQGSISGSRIEANIHHGLFVSDGATISVADTLVANNTLTGIFAVSSTAAKTTLMVDRTEMTGNEYGAAISAVPGPIVVNITRSNVSQNSLQGIEAFGFGNVLVSLTDSIIADNVASGIRLNTVSGTSVTVIVGGNRVVNNNIGLENGAGGTMQSRGDNTVSGNGADVVGALTALSGI